MTECIENDELYWTDNLGIILLDNAIRNEYNCQF